MIRFILCCFFLVLVGCDETDNCNLPFFSECSQWDEECNEDTVCDEGYDCVVISGNDNCVEAY